MMPFVQLHEWDDLKPGDVLLFLPCQTQAPALASKIIMFAQSIRYAREGYYALTHAAIYAGHNAQGHQLIHVAEKGFRYRIDSLEALEEEEHEKRPFMIFRAESTQMGEQIALVAKAVGEKLEKERKFIRWSFFSAASSLSYRSSLAANLALPEENKIQEQTHCSKFAAQCIQFAARNIKSPHFALNIHSAVTPAGLFKALLHQGHYQQLTYLAGIDPYEALKKEINQHLARVGNRHDANSKTKYHQCVESFSVCCWQLDKTVMSALEKCIALMKNLLPLLAQHTKFSLYEEALSARKVREWGRNNGIFNPAYSM